MLGRWPSTWEEVRASGRRYMNADDVKPESDDFFRPMHVELSPVAGDACIVQFRFKNLLGFPYTESKKLTWSDEKERYIAKEEWHNYWAGAIFTSFRDWVRSKGGGIVPSNLNGVQANIAMWNSDEPEIKDVRLAGGISGLSLGALAPNRPCLVFTFVDGAKRQALADGTVKNF